MRMKRMKQRAAALGIAVLGALGMGVFVASPAEAVTPCPPNARLCVNEHAGYEGWQIFNYPGGSDQINFEPSRLNNAISSIRNHDSASWCFYENVNRSGNKYQVYPGWDVHQVPDYINDVISLAVRGNC